MPIRMRASTWSIVVLVSVSTSIQARTPSGFHSNGSELRDENTLPSGAGQGLTIAGLTPSQWLSEGRWLSKASSDEIRDRALSLGSQKSEKLLRDEFFSKLDNTEFSMRVGDGKPVFEILTVQPLSESEDKRNTFFTQLSAGGHDGRTTLNLGVGYRRLTEDKTWLLGVNAFYDHELPYDHQRGSVGLELRSTVAELNLNRYIAISGYRMDRDGIQARALGGHDIEFGVQAPYLPRVKLYAKAFSWYGEDGQRDTKGADYSVRGMISPEVSIEIKRTNYELTTLRDATRVMLTYRVTSQSQKKAFGATPFVTKTPYQMQSMEPFRLEKVRRENRIIKQKKFSLTASGF